jgi:hypothetical protein
MLARTLLRRLTRAEKNKPVRSCRLLSHTLLLAICGTGLPVLLKGEAPGAILQNLCVSW